MREHGNIVFPRKRAAVRQVRSSLEKSLVIRRLHRMEGKNPDSVQEQAEHRHQQADSDRILPFQPLSKGQAFSEKQSKERKHQDRSKKRNKIGFVFPIPQRAQKDGKSRKEGRKDQNDSA